MMILVSLWSCDKCGEIAATTGRGPTLGSAGWTLGDIDLCGACSVQEVFSEDVMGEAGVALDTEQRCP